VHEMPLTRLSTVPNVLPNIASPRFRNWIHVSLCLIQATALSWALLAPDPFSLVRDTSFSWVQSVSDLLIHTCVFIVLSTTVFSLCYAMFGEFPAVAVFAMLGYCLIVEGLQAFVPGRCCDPRDAIANVTGFVVGLAAVRVLAMVRPATAET
jgi:VanZ family protein